MLGAVAGAAIVWVIGAVALHLPGQRDLREEVQRSRILGEINERAESVLTAIRAPMGPRRFLSNLLNAVQFTRYRIDRVPLYELARCGLPVPEPVHPRYTGLPPTGP